MAPQGRGSPIAIEIRRTHTRCIIIYCIFKNRIKISIYIPVLGESCAPSRNTK